MSQHIANRMSAVFDFDSTLQAIRQLGQVNENLMRLSSGKRIDFPNDYHMRRRNGDTLSTLFDLVGPKDGAGLPLRFLWEKEQRDCLITNEELLRRQVEAVLLKLTVRESVELASRVMQPMPGANSFFGTLQAAGVDIVIVSNGCDQLQAGLMSTYFPELTNWQLFANILEGNQQRALHPPIGVHKGIIVNKLKKPPLIFCGDSLGDVDGALATANLGGHIFCLADGLTEWCRQNLQATQWTQACDYTQATPKLLELLAAHQNLN